MGKRYPYMDAFRQLGWVDSEGSTSATAPALPKKKQPRTKGNIYAELTDSSSSSSSSASSASSRESAGPVKFKSVRDKIRAKAKDAKDVAALARMEGGPVCQSCREGVLKPDAVYFGEGLKKDDIKRALMLSKAAKAFLIVGTSGQVAPACKLPKIAKSSGGAKVIEVSPRETDLSVTADMLLLGTAAEVLPALHEIILRKAEKTTRNRQSASRKEKIADRTKKRTQS